MASESERPELSAAVAPSLTEGKAAARDHVPQREVAARPLEFDESGFPVVQPVSEFVQRVRRLLGDG
jgi:hypothetical protein